MGHFVLRWWCVQAFFVFEAGLCGVGFRVWDYSLCACLVCVCAQGSSGGSWRRICFEVSLWVGMWVGIPGSGRC